MNSTMTKDNDLSTEKMLNKKTGSKMSFIIFWSLLIDLMAFTMILPLMPALMDHYQKTDPSDGLYQYFSSIINKFQVQVGAPDAANSVLFGGFLGSLFSFLQYVVSPLAGGLSDRYGRKPILLSCLIGIAVSYGLWAVSYNFAFFVIARIIGGLSKGNVSITMAIITDVSTASTRAAGMALVGIAFSMGFIIGPLIGAFIAKWAIFSGNMYWFVLPALFALFLSIVDIIFIFFFFEETLPKEKRAKSIAASLGHAMTYINIVSLFKFSAVQNLSQSGRESLIRLGLIYFVYLFLYSGLEFTLTFLTHYHFGFTPMHQGTMFFCIGLVMAVLQGGYVRRIATNKVKSAAFFGLLLIVPSYISVGAASTEILLYFGVFLYALSTAFVVPCLTTLASQFGGDDTKGTVLGVFRSLGALARALGPIVASVSFWTFGSRVTYLVGAIALLWPCYTLKKTKFKSE
ncbi:major facilitator superfamily domain-containing protein 10 [Halyomorpha halys]|uniref:major facilitator superfamily domain-containing protein 10 n=1 Tax=Halyomorpha halys TaxID=286706 RepID=UPI0006D4ECC8|nr:major facilitator superfamily domain-containing protein 10 [Halyomorpha halys]